MGIKNKKWFQAIMKVAPTIATALGGPFGGLAASVLKEVTGLDQAGVEKAIAEGNPEIFLQLQKANHQFEVRIEEMKIKKDELVYQDKDSARAMRVATKDWTPTILAGISMGFFAWLVVTIFNDLSIVQNHGEFVYYLFGFGTAIVKQCFDFFLGSSIGSKAKDQFAWSRAGQ